MECAVRPGLFDFLQSRDGQRKKLSRFHHRSISKNMDAMVLKTERPS